MQCSKCNLSVLHTKDRGHKSFGTTGLCYQYFLFTKGLRLFFERPSSAPLQLGGLAKKNGRVGRCAVVTSKERTNMVACEVIWTRTLKQRHRKLGFWFWKCNMSRFTGQGGNRNCGPANKPWFLSSTVAQINHGFFRVQWGKENYSLPALFTRRKQHSLRMVSLIPAPYQCLISIANLSWRSHLQNMLIQCIEIIQPPEDTDIC